MVNKGDGAAISFSSPVIDGAAPSTSEDSTSTAVPYGHPEGVFTHEERLRDGHLLIRVATAVEVEGTGTPPIRRMERQPFTKEQFDSFADWADIAELLYREAPQDRAYWAERLAWAQEGILDGDGQKFVDEEMVDYCRAQWEQAPERVELEPFHINGLQEGADAVCDIRFADGTVGSVGLLAGDDGCFYYRRDREMASNIDLKTAADSRLTVAGPTVDDTQAAVLAQQTATALGAEGLAVDTVETRALVYEGSQIAIPAVCVVLVRRTDGLTAYDMGATFVMTERSYPAYGAPWPQERLEVCVDSEGLATIHWQGMARATEQIIPAELLPFEALLSRIAAQLAHLSPLALQPEWFYTIEVVRWRLGTSLTSIAGEPGAGAMVPTWYITYRETSAQAAGANGYTTERTIAFNALDGSYLEPRITNAMLMARGK